LQPLAAGVTFATVGVFCVVATCWTCVASVQKFFATIRVACASAVVWAVLLILVVSVLHSYDAVDFLQALILAGALSLLFTPIFAAPLAYSWNRHR